MLQNWIGSIGMEVKNFETRKPPSLERFRERDHSKLQKTQKYQEAKN